MIPHSPENRFSSHPDEISKDELSLINKKVREIVDLVLGKTATHPMSETDQTESIGDKVISIIEEEKKVLGGHFADKVAVRAKQRLEKFINPAFPDVKEAIEALAEYYRSN